jgi:hypothetical protein
MCGLLHVCIWCMCGSHTMSWCVYRLPCARVSERSSGGELRVLETPKLPPLVKNRRDGYRYRMMGKYGEVRTSTDLFNHACNATTLPNHTAWRSSVACNVFGKASRRGGHGVAPTTHAAQRLRPATPYFSIGALAALCNAIALGPHIYTIPWLKYRGRC